MFNQFNVYPCLLLKSDIGLCIYYVRGYDYKKNMFFVENVKNSEKR